MLDQTLIFDEQLIQRYNHFGLRYASYPSYAEFESDFGEQQYREQIIESNSDLIPRPLSLNIHLPADQYPSPQRANEYIQRLHKEIARQARLYDNDRQVEQIHWSGGVIRFLSPRQMALLMQVTRKYFNLICDRKQAFSISLDPRDIDDETFPALHDCGFNHVCFENDQIPATSDQTNWSNFYEQSGLAVQSARQHGFESVCLAASQDPALTCSSSIESKLDTIIRIDPDRVSLNYCSQTSTSEPEIAASQASIKTTSREALALFRTALTKLTDAGYIYIGMDYFTKTDDQLAQAQRAGQLNRNFQGYTTHTDCDVIGIGAGSLSQVADCFCQNISDEQRYVDGIDSGRLPIASGVLLDEDDLLRGDIIKQLLCNGVVDFKQIERVHHIQFHAYFDNELENLKTLEFDGLLSINSERIHVLPAGRLLVAHLCKIFDAYLSHQTA